MHIVLFVPLDYYLFSILLVLDAVNEDWDGRDVAVELGTLWEMDCIPGSRLVLFNRLAI
jgi:hypothetical protein